MVSAWRKDTGVAELVLALAFPISNCNKKGISNYPSSYPSRWSILACQIFMILRSNLHDFACAISCSAGEFLVLTC